MKEHGPWKILESEQKYKNPWVELVEDKVIRPDGKEGIYATVKLKNGVSILPLDEEGNVYLVEQFAYPLGKNIITPVSGGVEEGETPLVSGKRELKEELGFAAEEWIDLGKVHPFPGYVSHSAQLYLVRKLTPSKEEPDPTEPVKPVKVKLKEAVQMVFENKITHAQGCVLILRVQEYLRKENV
jgi:ADP-ribose pyrophosphatase